MCMNTALHNQQSEGVMISMHIEVLHCKHERELIIKKSTQKSYIKIIFSTTYRKNDGSRPPCLILHVNNDFLFLTIKDLIVFFFLLILNIQMISIVINLYDLRSFFLIMKTVAHVVCFSPATLLFSYSWQR